MVDTSERTSLKILLCSDFHEEWPDLDKVCEREASDFDFVLVSGDQAVANNVVGAVND